MFGEETLLKVSQDVDDFNFFLNKLNFNSHYDLGGLALHSYFF